MTIATKSPTTNTGSSWTNPTYAYDDGGTGAATITSAKPSGNNVWGTYGFSLVGATITQVRVRYDALTGGNENIRIDVSWDGGTTWSAQQVTQLTDTETTYWYDVTAETAWTPEKLADGQLQVRADAYTVGGAGSVSLDWLPVEVTYTTGVTEQLAGISNGVATVSGSLKVSKKLVGAASGIASVSGDIKVSKGIAGVVVGVSTVSGAVKISKKIAGVIAGVASVTGALSRIKGLAGVSGGIASVSGVIKRTRGLAGVSVGLASISGAVKVTHKLAGIVGGVASVSGAIKIKRGLSGIVAGIASVIGGLSVTSGEAESDLRSLDGSFTSRNLDTGDGQLRDLDGYIICKDLE